jgi:ssDNA-binding replication factor A large subunit
MRGVNLRAVVSEIAESELVAKRFGTRASVASAVLSDGTGKIRLCLWNEQIGALSAAMWNGGW